MTGVQTCALPIYMTGDDGIVRMRYEDEDSTDESHGETTSLYNDEDFERHDATFETAYLICRMKTGRN